MTTYNDIANRSDRNFQIECKIKLGRVRYQQLLIIAGQRFQRGLKHPDPNKRKNTARRMYNSVFTKALMGDFL